MPLCIVCREYRTLILHSAAEKLSIEQQIDTAATGATITIETPEGRVVAVRISEGGRVEHIGLPLFSDVMRQQMPSPAYDCVEYAALDRCVLHSENDLLLQKIQLLKGTWQAVSNILPTDECSIAMHNEKAYQIVWRRNGEEIANMAVPIDYELLSVSSRRELEKCLANDVVHQRVKRSPYQLVEELLQRTADEGIYVLPGESFLMKGLSRNTFYKRYIVTQKVDTITYEEERFECLVDKNHPAETMANLLISCDPHLPDAELLLELLLSSNEKRTLNITLRQWLSYCESQGCTPYFIYEKSDDTHSKGCLIMRNKTMGYNHMVLLTCRLDELTNDRPSFAGKAYLYIPHVEASRLFTTEEGLE